MTKTITVKGETSNLKWGIKKLDVRTARRLNFDLNLVDSLHFNHDGSLLLYDHSGNLLPFVIPCSKITVNGERVYIEKLTTEEFQGIVKFLEALGMTFKTSKRNEVVILRRVDLHERNQHKSSKKP
jgi:hypothetical protein